MTADSDTNIETMLATVSSRVQAGEPLEVALAEVPSEQRDEVTALLGAASRLGVLRREPRPEFAATLEARLLSAPAPAPTSSLRAPSMLGRLFRGPTWVKAAALCAVVLVGLIGSGAFLTSASADSLPDSPLYPVRQVREWVQLKLARGSTEQVSTYSSQIDDRGADLERALRLSKSPSVVQELSDNASSAAARMVDIALRTQGDATTRPVARALVTLRLEQQRVARIAAASRPEVRAVLDDLVTELDAQESRLLAGLQRPGRLR